jgi:hypothetical protein
MKHGHCIKYTTTRLYRIWKGMIARCSYSYHESFPNYGGRGIKICSAWLDFQQFAFWASQNGYQPSLVIDRKNKNGNYEPDNCQWTAQKDNNNNTRANVHITMFGETKTIAQWGEDTRCAVNKKTFTNRISYRKMPPELAFRLPARKGLRQW